MPNDREEATGFRVKISQLRSRITDLESSIGASEGEDASEAADRFAYSSYARGYGAAQAEIAHLTKRVDDLLEANTREVERRRRVQATVKLMCDVMDALGRVEINDV